MFTFIAVSYTHLDVYKRQVYSHFIVFIILFVDLFESLVPMAVHQAIAAYDVRKNSLVGAEVTKLREATQLLNRFVSCISCKLWLPLASN